MIRLRIRRRQQLLIPRESLINPGPQQADFLLGERLAAAIDRWHAILGGGGAHMLDDLAFGGLAGLRERVAGAVAEDFVAHVKAVAGL